MHRSPSSLREERGLSVTVNYSLSLVIVTVLMSGLFIGMNGFLEDEREKAIRGEFSVLGNRIASDVAAADRLAQTAEGPTARVAVRTRIPGRVAGSRFQIEVTSTAVDQPPGGAVEYYDVNFTLVSTETGIRRTVSVRTANDVAETTIAGGSYLVVYDGTELVMKNV